jgi:hypothetical protein
LATAARAKTKATWRPTRGLGAILNVGNASLEKLGNFERVDERRTVAVTAEEVKTESKDDTKERNAVFISPGEKQNQNTTVTLTFFSREVCFVFVLKRKEESAEKICKYGLPAGKS